MSALVLTDAGPWVSIQDLGRPGFQRYGISESGAADPISLRLANRVLGNGDGMAAFEIAAPGIALMVEDRGAVFAACGPSLSVTVDNEPAPQDATLRLAAGSALRVRPGRGAVYAYLSVAGGFALSTQFGSCAFHARSGIGGHDGEPLRSGLRLPLPDTVPEPARMAIGAPPYDAGPIRVVRGPQADHLTAEALARFFVSAWQVDPRSDRMGVRLTGHDLAHSAKGPDTISDGVALGSLQLPGNGQPIVLGPDRQTTGGYPKFGVIARADLPRFFQTPPGASLRFTEISREGAVAALAAQHRQLKALRAMRVAGDLDAERLLSLNLIDGVYGPGT
ncbi:MAG: biotin-dependent carboxyltransferase family protein [Pseudomonadota bacterium]